MKMKEIMSKHLIVGKSNDSIQAISKLMKEYDIGFLPISKKNKIIGVITDRDIVVKALSNCAKGSTKIEDYISKVIITCNIDDDVEKVLNIMKENKIKRIIVNDNNKMVGIISISDLLDNKDIIKTIKSIYEINKNNDYYKTEIDEFYL